MLIRETHLALSLSVFLDLPGMVTLDGSVGGDFMPCDL